MEEEGIVGLRILDQPVHGAEDIGLGRLAHGVLLVIREEDHIFAGISEVLIEICRHVLNIVNASSQLTLLAEIVDSNQQCLSLTSTARVLEVVTLWSAVSERDWSSRRSRRTATAAAATLWVVVCYKDRMSARNSENAKV